MNDPAMTCATPLPEGVARNAHHPIATMEDASRRMVEYAMNVQGYREEFCANVRYCRPATPPGSAPGPQPCPSAASGDSFPAEGGMKAVVGFVASSPDCNIELPLCDSDLCEASLMVRELRDENAALRDCVRGLVEAIERHGKKEAYLGEEIENALDVAGKLLNGSE